MRFSFENKHYAIEFSRTYALSPEGERTRFPNTTVRILEIESPDGSTKNAPVFREATVGCWHGEPQFVKDVGRKRALHNVMRTLPKGMKSLVWDAYENRGLRPRRPKPPTPAIMFPIQPKRRPPMAFIDLGRGDFEILENFTPRLQLVS